MDCGKIRIYGAHVIPRDIQTFTDKLDQVLYDVGGKIVVNGIKLLSAQNQEPRLDQRVNRNKKGAEGQKQRTRTIMIKVLGL